ncbi:MAG: hypothetical protein HY319_32660 [Armatimonadetes bacterium]|nr:hypothetical protein [Armatimonadota bacterium]
MQQLTGQPVYLNSSWRPGAGMIRRDGARQGGRYRVNRIEPRADGSYDVSFLGGGIHFTYDPENPPRDQRLTSRTGRPLTLAAARELLQQS